MQADHIDLPTPAGRRADLHLHSICSDGRSSPAEVVRAAREAELAAIALTDHDTVAGVAEAAAAAAAVGLDFVTGIELSTYDPERGSIHVLGYGVDPAHPGFADHLCRARDGRRERAREIVARLNRLGIGVTMEQVFAQASGDGLLARPHVARALLAGGWVRSYREAFDRYIAAGRPAYVPAGQLDVAGAIELLHDAGGLAVLAHPGPDLTGSRLDEWVEMGLDGLETLHPDHDRATAVRLRRLAAERGLLETGGSDWHGPREDGGGRKPASQPVPYEWYRRLSRACDARRQSVDANESDESDAGMKRGSNRGES